MTDWKPVNPCIDCTNYKEYRFFYTDCPVSGDCHKELDYKYGVPAQRKLLEYLSANPPDFSNYSDNYSYTKTIQSMLKELKERK